LRKPKEFKLNVFYRTLEVESTKLWHLSPCALVELLNSELETGNIIFPEEA
jgi:hypothetical protein